MGVSDKTIRVSGECYARLRALNDSAPALGGGAIGGVVGILSLASVDDAVGILQRRALENGEPVKEASPPARG